jgi:hypothetical protein
MKRTIVAGLIVFSLILPNLTHAQSVKDRVLGLFRYFQGSGLASVKKSPSTTSGSLSPLSADGIVYSSDALYTWSGSSPETLSITQGTVTFTTNTFSFHPNLIVSASGGNVLFQVPNSLTGLTLNGGSATLATGTNNVLTTKSLSITNNSYLDITNGGVIVDYSGTSPLTTIRGYLLSGRGCTGICGATWTGLGIRSSSAALLNSLAPDHFGIGYGENKDMPLGSFTPTDSFMGIVPDQTAVVLRFTEAADANLDGKTGDFDVSIIGGFYDQDRIGQKHFYQGDFDYSGTVGDFDVTLIGGIFNENLQTTNLVATPSSNSVTLNWSKPYYTGNTIILKQIASGAWFQLTATQNTTLTDSSVTPGTVYTYQVKGVNGQPSNLVQVKVPAVPQVPAAPSNLVATAVSSTQINLTWSDNSSNETGFVLEKKTGTGGYGTVASPFQNATSYPNTALTPATTYTYRIKATNASGDSTYSNEASATTQTANCGTLCVPALSSKPGAPITIYLDFDGDPARTWAGYNVPITPALDSDSNTSSFSTSELNDINQTWSRVSEQFSLFNINVTTVDPGTYPDGIGMHVIIGGSPSWTGFLFSGISQWNSFHDSSENTAYVFNSFPGVLAQSVAHEFGNTFGLGVQNVYNPNTHTSAPNTGITNYGPIMGNAAGTRRGLWWNGISVFVYNNSTGQLLTTPQNDLDFFANGATVQAGVGTITIPGIGYRPDDYGNTIATAQALPNPKTKLGVIEQTNDVDYFSFTTTGGNASITVTGNTYGQMLDPKVTLYNASGAQVASADTALPTLNETLSTTLSAGTYYLKVEGHGWLSCGIGTQGYECYQGADIGQYTITVTAP